MTRIILATIAGGIAMFMWGWISWMFLPWHHTTMHGLPQEDAVITALQANITQGGAYVFPHCDEYGMEGPKWDAFVAKHEAGPRGMVYYLPEGAPTMPPSMFVKGFLLNLGASLLTVLMLTCAAAKCNCVPSRIMFAAMIGIAAALMTDIMLLNWMPLPVGYQLVNAADTVIAFIVGSIPIALILKRDKACATSEQPTASPDAA